MHRISHSDIQTLTEHQDGPAISVYMRTQGSDFADNRAHLKYLLTKAREELTEFASYKEKHEALYPAYRLLHDRDWWERTDAGVAIFSTHDSLRAFHVAFEPHEQIIASNHFHILPLLESMNHSAVYYILALSTKHSRVLRSDGHDIEEVSIANMPSSIDTFVGSEASTKTQHQHPHLHKALRRVRDGGRRAIQRERQGVAEEQYLHAIHDAVDSFFTNKHAPVVVAGSKKVAALYRKLADVPYLHKEAITGNPDKMQLMALRNKANDLLDNYFSTRELAAQSHFLKLSAASPERIVYGLQAVIQSIYAGRVQAIFIDRSATLWGKMQRSIVQLHKRRFSGDDNLLDIAASETLKRKGAVFTIDHTDLPQNSGLAAILRY
jgi:hypothetical protein